jgi:hypothetical protein
MQRRTIWDQSISSGLTSSRDARAPVVTLEALAWLTLPGGSAPPASLGWGLRRGGFGGVANPITLQLNVPTHCIAGLTQNLLPLFPEEFN